ncbi:procyclic form-specific polypeptide A-beta-like isoform X2 [Mercenaria mercenaria]|nr:procyclic form-specific polypeptide A-beta-like isoform X2 [Mercenaria mercenaria]
MRFYMVAILSMGLVLLLTISKVSAADAEPATSPKPEEEGGSEGETNGEAEDEPAVEPGAEPDEEPKGSTKPPENGCNLSMLSTITLIQTLVMARILM